MIQERFLHVVPIKRQSTGVDYLRALKLFLDKNMSFDWINLLFSGLLPSYLLTPWSRVLLEKLTGSHLVKKLHAFYGTPRIITTFTSARHLSLSWARSTQFMPPHPTSWRAILILCSHLRLALSSGLFPWGCPPKTLNAPLSMCYIRRPSHSSRFDHPNNIRWGLQIIKPLYIQFSRYFVPLRPKYSPQHPILKHPQPKFLPQCERPSSTPIQNIRQNYTSVYLNPRRLMSYIYGAPILDVSRSHTTTQHSR